MQTRLPKARVKLRRHQRLNKSLEYSAVGLKIRGGWHIVNHHTEKPLFQGTKTLAMARHIYGIADPDEEQMALF